MLTDYAATPTTELWNTARLQAYLTNVGSPFDSGPDVCRCDTLTAAVLGDDPYTTPDDEASPAPWYDVDVPESAQFLGFLPLTMDGIDNNPRARNVTGAVGGGGVFSAARDLPRTITVTGLLLGSSCCGVDYGLHFLTEALNSCAAGACDGTCLSMYSCCPEEGLTPEQFNAKYRRNFVRTSVVSGPDVIRRDGSGSCSTSGCTGADIIQVEFVLVAANPWAWTDPAPTLDVPVPVSGTGFCVDWCTDVEGASCEGEPCLFQDCADPTQCQDPLSTFVAPPEPTAPAMSFCVPLAPERECYSIDLSDRPRWSEDFPIVTVTAGEVDLRNIRIVFYENANPSQPCGDTADMLLCNPIIDLYVTYIPGGSSVTIDGRTGKSTMTCFGRCVPATTVYGSSDGAPFVPAGLSCASYCVCIESDSNFPTGGDGTVSVELSGRGL